VLGRKTYTDAEIDTAKSAVTGYLASYRKLSKAVDASGDAKARVALQDFEAAAFNALALALDRPFVHRVRAVTGKDGNPVNELEIIAESLITHDGVMTGNNVIKLEASESVTKIKYGDRIKLTAAQFESLAKAFFVELERKFH
jgi:hypothetical protein